ncbi:MAG: zinc metalloprotease HtpX [Carbonactinosporaceae bacterium]
MATTRYAPDRGLTARMLFTMFGLGLVYVVFIAALIVALGRAWPFAIAIAGAVFAAQYYFSDKLALRAMRAHVVGPEQEPELHGVVDRLCALADMSKPRVAVAETDVPNAFATGRSASTSVLCVTRGLVRRLDGAELEGVLSHELSHVAHRDVAVMTLASFLGVLAGVVARFQLYTGGFGRDRRDQNTFVVFAVVTLVSVLVYVVSFLLIRLLSRYRELSADRTGALLTGNPAALASALTKITGEMGRIPTRDLRRAEPFNAFFFTPAMSGRASITHLLSTHPTLEQRLEQLGRLSRELGTG